MPVRMWRSDHFQLNALDMCSVFPGGQGSVTRLQHVSVSAQCGLTWVPDHIPSDTCQLCDHSHVYFIMETLHSTKFKQWKPMYSNGECLIQSLPSSTTLITNPIRNVVVFINIPSVITSFAGVIWPFSLLLCQSGIESHEPVICRFFFFFLQHGNKKVCTLWKNNTLQAIYSKSTWTASFIVTVIEKITPLFIETHSFTVRWQCTHPPGFVIYKRY